MYVTNSTKASIVEYTCNPNTQETEPKDHKFETGLSYNHSESPIQRTIGIFSASAISSFFFLPSVVPEIVLSLRWLLKEVATLINIQTWGSEVPSQCTINIDFLWSFVASLRSKYLQFPLWFSIIHELCRKIVPAFYKSGLILLLILMSNLIAYGVRMWSMAYTLGNQLRLAF